MKNLFLWSAGIIFLLHSCLSGTNEKFIISKGVNINHWLSQSHKRGIYRDTVFTEKDIVYIKSMGFDHIRLPFDEEQLWDDTGKKNDTAFTLLHNAIGWCQANHLRVIADLHILRSFHFNRKDNKLWDDIREQDKFVNLWVQLSAEMKKYPVWLIGYELMNEPVTDNPDNWNHLVSRTIDTLRKLEPLRKIIIGSNMWQSTTTFKDLRVPENDSNLILSFHFYEPFLLTHHQASWTYIRHFKGPVVYPGKIIPEPIFAALPDSTKDVIKQHNTLFNRDTLESLVRLAINRANELNLPVFCGEWGCRQIIDHPTRMQWYRDMIWIFNKYRIPWDIWGYYGEFGLFNHQTGELNKEMLKIITN